jgi:hypothetical protein
VSSGIEANVVALLGAGASPSTANSKGQTPLLVPVSPALTCSHTRTDVESPSLVAFARHYAASKARIEIGRRLIQKGADVNAKDRASQLPLHRAATTGSDGFVSLLLAGGKDGKRARLNTQDRMGMFCSSPATGSLGWAGRPA